MKTSCGMAPHLASFPAAGKVALCGRGGAGCVQPPYLLVASA
jgi:hypothetical protein